MLSNLGMSQKDAQWGQSWASFWSVFLLIPRYKKKRLASESGRALENRLR